MDKRHLAPMASGTGELEHSPVDPGEREIKRCRRIALTINGRTIVERYTSGGTFPYFPYLPRVPTVLSPLYT